MDNDVVVTVGHKVKDFVNNPSGLKVRLGDWNPNIRDSAEEHPHIEKSVSCVRLHPDADLGNTLANNVAVLKLDQKEKFTDVRKRAVASVIDFKSAPIRPADTPEGVRGSSKLDKTSFLDLRLGLISVDQGLDPLGNQPNSPDNQQNRPARDAEIAQSYINTVCLPRNERQFQNFEGKCWVAAWGQDLKRQREVDLPLVSNSQCERSLRPIFEERGVRNWKLQPSEVCAGGVRGKDSCEGEGGAPLVCYDKVRKLMESGFLYIFYYRIQISILPWDWSAMGLADNTYPAVYTNLGDSSVKQFITSAFSNNNFC